MVTAGSKLAPNSVSSRARLCENALNTSKTEILEVCLWNQRSEARISLVSDLDFRNAVSTTHSGVHGVASLCGGRVRK